MPHAAGTPLSPGSFGAETTCSGCSWSLSTRLVSEPSGTGCSPSAQLECVGQLQGFSHGHFLTPKAVLFGGALDTDLIQTLDNPGGPDKP